MTKGGPKGSAFERQICKDLGKWWTKGERDDVILEPNDLVWIPESVF